MESSYNRSEPQALSSMRSELAPLQLSGASYPSSSNLQCISGSHSPTSISVRSSLTSPSDVSSVNSSIQSFPLSPHLQQQQSLYQQHPQISLGSFNQQPQQSFSLQQSPQHQQPCVNISNNGTNSTAMSQSMSDGMPFVRILEQPARCALRFRYECEGRSAGSIPGCNSTAENKTFPTIELINYNGPAAVVVSCVTKQAPYRPHPHNLVGKEGCKKGVCTMIIKAGQNRCTFTSLGIQCVKKKDIEESLRLRESIKVDPFRTGFAHKTQASNIDLNVVRLCFQVFLESGEKEKFTIPLPPVVSDPIYDKKAMSDLIITKLSHCSSPVTGGKEVILLCDRVTKDDIQVRFYEERNEQLLWEAFGEFQPADVHKQVAICFRTPKYYSVDIIQPHTVQVQLRRPSDGHTSEPRPFQFVPVLSCLGSPDDEYGSGNGEGQISRKRAKVEQMHSISRYYRDQGAFGTQQQPSPQTTTPLGVNDCRVPRLNSPSTMDSNTSQSMQASASQSTHCDQIGTGTGNERSSSMFGMASLSNTGESFGYTPIFGKLTIKMEPSNETQQPNYYSSLQQHSGQQQQQQQQPLHHQQQQLSPQHMLTQQHTNLSNQQSIYGGSIGGGMLNNTFQPAALSPVMEGAISPIMTGNNASGLSPALATGNALSPTLTGAQLSRATGSSPSNAPGGETEQQITERMDSLDLDIDANDLISDINFNNMMVMMDSGNNITFNSSGNIKIEPGLDALLGGSNNGNSNENTFLSDQFGILGGGRMNQRQ